MQTKTQPLRLCKHYFKESHFRRAVLSGGSFSSTANKNQVGLILLLIGFLEPLALDLPSMRNSVHSGNIQTMSITNNTDSLIGSGIGSGLGGFGFGPFGYGRDNNDGVAFAAIASIAASQRDRGCHGHDHGRRGDDCGHTLHGIAATERARDSITSSIESARSEIAGQIDRSKDFLGLKLGQLHQDVNAGNLANVRAHGEILKSVGDSEARISLGQRDILIHLLKEAGETRETVRQKACEVEKEIRCEADKTRREVECLKAKVEDNDKERLRERIAKLEHASLAALIASKCGPAATCPGSDGPGNS